MFDHIKIKSKASSVTPAKPAVSPGEAPTKKQIYQSRQNFGVNLGACFVMEKWIYHGLFVDDSDCELEAVKRAVKKFGNDEAREKFEDHWNGFMSDNDWKWLQDHNVTSVRVPLGYWEVGGGKYADDTQFKKYAGKVYKNAWDIFKTKFVEAAGAHDIGVVVDIHGLPGGANGDAHSGEKSGGSAEFWGDYSMQLQMCDMLQFMAKDLKQYDNITGIQIVNESEFSNDAKSQNYYYSAAINLIREVDQEVPIIISDGWWPDQWVKWVQSKQGNDKNLGVVVDHHCYRCAAQHDKDKAPPQIIGDLYNDLLTNLTDNGLGVDFMVGEYSCVMDGQSWDKGNSNSNRDQLVIDFGNNQLRLFNERAKFGSFFWTFKFQAGNGGEWDFKTMTDKGSLNNNLLLKGKKLPDDNKFEEKLNHEFNCHCDYWDNANKKEKYDHDRFKDGFQDGWKDALEFAKFNGSVLGRKEAWKFARRSENIDKKGNLKHIWEYGHGFDTGLREFFNSV